MLVCMIELCLYCSGWLTTFKKHAYFYWILEKPRCSLQQQSKSQILILVMKKYTMVLWCQLCPENK
jgi:hypothetical protein